MRRAILRLATPVDRVLRWRSAALLPPAHLRIYYYRTWNPDAFLRACAGARVELVSRGLRPEHRVLDVGSGVGNLALGLADYLQGGYDGVEIHAEAAAWCQRAITRRHPAFRFHRADLSSQAYNPGGELAASSYRFPFAERSFDFAYLGSVFTHMLPGGVEAYLQEIARVLRPGGRCVASFFLLNEESLRGVEAGRSFMSFAHADASGLGRLHDAAVPEAAVALDEASVRRFHAAAGLAIEDVRRGGWWSGARHDQDVVTSRRAP